MVQLILEAAQGASTCEYLDTCRWAERGELPEGAHPCRTDDFLADAAFAALARAQAHPSAAAFQLRLSGFEGHVLQPKNSSATGALLMKSGIIPRYGDRALPVLDVPDVLLQRRRLSALLLLGSNR